MPSSLNKVTKSISKKRQGKHGKSTSLNALHENSRDAKRIRRAAARDDKVDRGERARRGRDEKFLTRMAFFHSLINLPASATSLLASRTSLPSTTPADTDPSPLPAQDVSMTDAPLQSTPTFSLPAIRSLITLFLSRHDATLAEHVATRRPGRPKAPAHVALEQEIDAERAEFDSGFWTVDLRDERNVKEFRDWKGDRGALGGFDFVRVDKAGGVRSSSFPPGGKGE